VSWYLQWPPYDAYIITPDWVPTSSDDLCIEVDVYLSSLDTNNQTIIGREDGASSLRTWKLFVDGSNIGVLHNSNWTVGGFILAPITLDARNLIRVEFDSTEIKLYVNDVLQNTAARNLMAVDGRSHLRSIGRSLVVSTAISHMRLYRLKAWDDAARTTLALDYDPSASSGTGSILVDTVGGNNGALTGFPTDSSQWVSYGAASPPTLGTITTTAVTSNSISFSLPVTY